MAKYNHDWHTDECVRSQEYVRNGIKRFFCMTHRQWAAEMPVRLEKIYTYADGTQFRETVKMA